LADSHFAPGRHDVLEQTPSRRDQILLFARNFFKHPRMLGSLIPSSRFLIREVMNRIDWSRARVIVEFGPGVGTLTTEMLRRLPADGRLIVFETNPEFVRFLQTAVRDPRLHVVHGSADGIDAVLAELGLPGADFVVSGIPFTTIPQPVRDSILRKTRDAVQPSGAFIVYQFTTAVLPYLESTFGEVRRGYEPLNILPAQLFYCTP
jgi:phospholipid N-methyltransferase